MKKKYVSWRRVSTFKQNKSGLGLEAQKDIIKYFVSREDGELIADYSECYTGKELSGCVELRKAMTHAKKENAILIIAKSDRFRNCQEALSILDEMGEGNIEFCDIPHTDRFTLTLFFALAEREALLVSIRTKQALAVCKERGVLIGAASEKYKASMTQEKVAMMHAKKGATKNLRYLQSRDVVAFLKILRRVFPHATQSANPRNWIWCEINTKVNNRDAMYQLMKDFREMDESGKLFIKWDLSDTDSLKAHRKIAAYISGLRRSVLNSNNL